MLIKKNKKRHLTCGHVLQKRVFISTNYVLIKEICFKMANLKTHLS